MIYIYSEPNFTLNQLYYIKSNEQKININTESNIDMIKDIYLTEDNKFIRNEKEFTLDKSELTKGEHNPYFLIKGDSSNNKYNITSNNIEIKINIYENENDLYEIIVNDCNYYNDEDFSVKFTLKEENFPIKDMKIFLYIGNDESIELIYQENTKYEYSYTDVKNLNTLKDKTVDLIISENDEINYISKISISFTDFNYIKNLKNLYNSNKFNISN